MILVIGYISVENKLEIISKFVEPENPYIKEQPYNNKPEDNALSIKYFTPDSEDNKLSRLKDAKTYKAKD